jgi:hypothetical protein
MRSRVAVVVLAGVLGTGCGGRADVAEPGRPQTIRLDWHELDGVDAVGFQFDVRALRIEERGWAVQAGVTNRTDATFRITRPHVRGGTKFGLFVLRSDSAREWRQRVAARRLTPELLASRFEPPIPQLLRPGARWIGTFSGPGRPPAGSFVRIAFGRFVTTETPPRGLPAELLAVTRRAARIDA